MASSATFLSDLPFEARARAPTLTERSNLRINLRFQARSFLLYPTPSHCRTYINAPCLSTTWPPFCDLASPLPNYNPDSLQLLFTLRRFMSLMPLKHLSRAAVLSARGSQTLFVFNARSSLPCSRRQFSVSTSARVPTRELSKDPLAVSGIHKVGTEGLHKRTYLLRSLQILCSAIVGTMELTPFSADDLPTSSSAAPKAVVSTPSSSLAASSTGMGALALDPTSGSHQGDWVLFHPVYTQDELKAVRVLQHERKTTGDKVASLFVAALRFVAHLLPSIF